MFNLAFLIDSHGEIAFTEEYEQGLDAQGLGEYFQDEKQRFEKTDYDLVIIAVKA